MDGKGREYVKQGTKLRKGEWEKLLENGKLD